MCILEKYIQRAGLFRTRRDPNNSLRQYIFRWFGMLADCLNNYVVLLFVSHITHRRQQTYIITNVHLTCDAG